MSLVRREDIMRQIDSGATLDETLSQTIIAAATAFREEYLQK